MENSQNQEIQPVNRSVPKRAIPTFIGIAIIVVVAIILFGGVFAYQYFFVKPQPVVQTQAQSQTAGWKTYTNSEYGFKLKYPSDFVKEFDDNAEFTIGGSTTDKLNISAVGVKFVKLSRIDSIGKMECFNAQNNKTYECTVKTEDGIGFYVANVDIVIINKNPLVYKTNKNFLGKETRGYFFGIENEGTDAYFVSLGQGKTLIITGSYSYTSDDYVRSGELLKQIAPTLEFITPAAQAGWKTYTNAQYGFEIKYPSDWVYKKTKQSSGVGDTIRFVNPDGVYTVEINNPIREIGYESVELIKTEQIKIENINKYFTKKTYNPIVGGANNLIIASWNSDDWKNSGEIILPYPPGADNVPEVGILNQMLSTFKFTTLTAAEKICQRVADNISGRITIKEKNFSWEPNCLEKKLNEEYSVFIIRYSTYIVTYLYKSKTNEIVYLDDDDAMFNHPRDVGISLIQPDLLRTSLGWGDIGSGSVGYKYFDLKNGDNIFSVNKQFSINPGADSKMIFTYKGKEYILKPVLTIGNNDCGGGGNGLDRLTVKDFELNGRALNLFASPRVFASNPRNQSICEASSIKSFDVNFDNNKELKTVDLHFNGVNMGVITVDFGNMTSDGNPNIFVK